ncbi:MAG TPA: class I SAM-dependent methyltransferase [Micromonosporaceae bacterium]|jgi:precorrin-6B methylase 2|nr:class I SAM-dependent methyltransferase [Micromonosporaceae bacterium]
MQTDPKLGWPDDEATRLHKIMFGYLGSTAIFSAMELGVFEALEKAPGTSEELADRLGLPQRSARVLLLALLGEQLLERDGDVYRNAPAASRFLVVTSPESVAPLAAHQAAHFVRFGQLTKALRENAPVRHEQQQGDHPAFGGPARFAQVTMSVARLLMLEGMVKNARLGGGRHLVDLGCGSCVYSIGLAKEYPDLRITAVDRPSVCELANGSVAEAGLTDRITVVPGDILADSFTGDAAMLCNVVEGFDAEHAQTLIRQVYSWLPDGGELLFHSHMWEHGHTPFPYSIGLILLVNNAMGGEPYGETVTRKWLEEAGFSSVEPAVAVSPISALIRAHK